ncbi:MAG: glycerate kinase type-2 family protein [Desulfuromonadales bacterium]
MRNKLDQIFRAGLERVNPYAMITKHVRLDGNHMVVTIGQQRISIDLGDFKRIVLLGAGKASAPMALALEELLGDRIDQGLVCVKYGHTADLKRVELVEAGHPIPDQRGVQAAKRMASLVTEADAETLVVNCISGGGSALLPYPMDQQTSRGLVDLTLEEKQQTTSALLRCGADIQEINCVRKHISAIKGGRLLQMLQPARMVNFILSDVVGDDLGSIASGMTTYDETTYARALDILSRFNILNDIPQPVLQALEYGANGRIPETVKCGDTSLERVDNILIGTNRQALQAAAARASELGFFVQTITAQLTGEARYAAKVIADIARDVAISDMFSAKPVCLLFGGETVVTLKGEGTGGRNQEMSLAFLREMSKWKNESRRVFFLAASTDGNDGPTDAAGGFADIGVCDMMNPCSFTEIETYLNANDSYHFLEKNGALYKTGPTNTNVCDMQIVLIL